MCIDVASALALALCTLCALCVLHLVDLQ
jgi:hypothetical protein